MSRFLLVPGEGMPEYEQCASEFSALWKFRYAVPCRQKKVSQVTPEDIADSNLVLIGTPDKHSLMQKIIEKLPVVFENEGLRLNGKQYSGPNLGAIMSYPNPLNPKRYVVLIAGTTSQSYT